MYFKAIAEGQKVPKQRALLILIVAESRRYLCKVTTAVIVIVGSLCRRVLYSAGTDSTIILC